MASCTSKTPQELQVNIENALKNLSTKLKDPGIRLSKSRRRRTCISPPLATVSGTRLKLRRAPWDKILLLPSSQYEMGPYCEAQLLLRGLQGRTKSSCWTTRSDPTLEASVKPGWSSRTPLSVNKWTSSPLRTSNKRPWEVSNWWVRQLL